MNQVGSDHRDLGRNCNDAPGRRTLPDNIYELPGLRAFRTFDTRTAAFSEPSLIPSYIKLNTLGHYHSHIHICNVIGRSSLLPQMVSLRSILQLSFFAAAPPSSNSKPEVRWGACNATEVSSRVPIVCGNLKVPLDYTEPSSNATLTLQLARVPASLQPSKGSILFNFGGPGATGRGTLGLLGPDLLA